MENMINTEYGANYAPEETQRMEEFREAAGHIFSENMIQDMAELGFFRYPASLSHHGDHIGGLYDHSMEVYRTLKHFTEQLELTWQRPESPLLIGIFHDWVKLQDYIEVGTRDEIRYMYDTQRIQGHGWLSVIRVQQFLQNHLRAPQLTNEEISCILYHMGAFTDKQEWNNYTNAVKLYPNVLWTHTADMVASQIKGI